MHIALDEPSLSDITGWSGTMWLTATGWTDVGPDQYRTAIPVSIRLPPTTFGVLKRHRRDAMFGNANNGTRRGGDVCPPAN